MLVKNGRVIDTKSNMDGFYDLRIKDGIIMEIEEDLEPLKNEKIIDATGLVVGPGLVDIHVHFREPGQTHKEDISSGARAAKAGGYTTVVAMANTDPIIDNVDLVKKVNEIMAKEDINIYSAAAISKGFEGLVLTDFAGLKDAGTVVLTDDGLPLSNTGLVYEAMKEARRLDMVLSFHEEDPFFIKNPGINHGKISKALKIDGAKRTAEDIMVARDIVLALETGAKIDIQHISSKNTVEMIRTGKKMGANVYGEVTPHHFSLTEEAIMDHGSLAKMNPPLRTEEDRLSIIEGLKDNTIEIIATDHAPHSKEEKDQPLLQAPSGIIGLETALSLIITNLVRPGHLTLMDALRKITINPASLLGLDGGFIRPGVQADLVIFDQDKEVIYQEFESKSSNSPFIGEKLYGKVLYTICKGKIVYQAS